jgi:hypothetical protein
MSRLSMFPPRPESIIGLFVRARPGSAWSTPADRKPPHGPPHEGPRRMRRAAA